MPDINAGAGSGAGFDYNILSTAERQDLLIKWANINFTHGVPELDAIVRILIAENTALHNEITTLKDDHDKQHRL